MTTIVTKNSSSTRLGVVTVTYSPGQHLCAFLDSLTASTHRPVDVILADNGSVDGAPQAAATAREEVSYLSTGGNLGYGTAINKAVTQIHGEFFLISNPDATFEPGSVDELIACAQRHPRAGAVGPRIVDEKTGETYPSARAVPTLSNGIGHALLAPMWPNNPFSRAYRDEADMDRERRAGWLSGACLLVRRQAFEAIGGFDERYFMYMEDVDFGDRLGRAGWENIYCPSAIIHHDQGHSTKNVRGPMLRVHHESAYRFQADRHPGWRGAPIRAVLWVGLKVRGWLLSRKDFA